MNYKNEAIRALQTLPKDYSLGDVLFASFQKRAVENGQSLNFLRSISDEDLYTDVEKAIKKETTEDE